MAIDVNKNRNYKDDKNNKEGIHINSDKNANVNPAAGNRYIIGIDLGTTNSAMMYIDTRSASGTFSIQPFPFFQATGPGISENRSTLPSFLYQPLESEKSGLTGDNRDTSNDSDYVVGTYARDYGQDHPGRQISSAKSWLCHSQVDRTAAFLPWKAPQEVKQISPVEASARYLKFMADCWDKAYPQYPLSQQDVVITLPASFDETARELTIKAAAKAGLKKIALIEEPQAAFYAWIYKQIKSGIGWDNQVKPGDKILVIDIGGGTSDFTLIQVQGTSESADSRQEVTFHRIAVGEHLLLGGDNIDLAIAKHLEHKFVQSGIKLSQRQWQTLVRQSRVVKETLFGINGPEICTAAIPAAGSKLIASSIHTDMSQQEARQILLDGFFPQVSLSAKPEKHLSGFQEFGLPFAPDAAITRYLADFLSSHRYTTASGEIEPEKDGIQSPETDPARPDAILFNGGMFESPLAKQRIIDQIVYWFTNSHNNTDIDNTTDEYINTGIDNNTGTNWMPLILDNDALDLAVARGAAYFGRVRRTDLNSNDSSSIVKIHATLARSYYIGLQTEDKLKAMCIAPAKIQAGELVKISEHLLELQVGTPVEFPLFVSSTRLTDPAGAIIEIDENQMRSLAPLKTVIRSSKSSQNGVVQVILEAALTEIGTLELALKSRSGRGKWQLNFDVRAAVETQTQIQNTTAESQGVLDDQIVESCRQILQNTFNNNPSIKPSEVFKRLTAIIGSGRDTWPATLLRKLWAELIESDGNTLNRPQSAAQEARWLNLLGFCLRPGLGAAMDDWRIEQTWKSVFGKLLFPVPDNRIQIWILWRRIAAGLSAGRQIQLTEPIISQLRTLFIKLQKSGKAKDWVFGGNETSEIFRMLGAMELLPVQRKEELGTMFFTLLQQPQFAANKPAILWALGRIGARESNFSSLETVVEIQTAEKWIKQLYDNFQFEPGALFAAVLMARKTSDRYRDISDSCRRLVLNWIDQTDKCNPNWRTIVQIGGTLDSQQQSEVFGESLPVGLCLG